MSIIRIRQRTVRRLLILVLIFACFSGVFSLLNLLENNQYQKAMLQEADEAARRRREGWIQVDGQWYSPRKDIETLLVFGVDQMEPFSDSGSYNNNGQADFFMLAVFDQTQENMTVLHINRDTMTQIPVLGVTGQHAGYITGQLALAHTYGSGLQDSCENTVDAVSLLLDGVEIDHYVAMTMSAVPQLNDLVGGVPVTVLDDFTGIDDTLIKGEQVTLLGQQALTYIRIRAGLEDSTNIKRMKRQQQYFESFMHQVSLLDEENIPDVNEIEVLSSNILSDCTINQLSDLAEKYAAYPLFELQTMAGETVQGTEYIEYYPDQVALEQQVLKLFYQKQGAVTNN